MEPGKELDALIAEKVMGWEISVNRLLYKIPGNPFWKGFTHIPDGPFRGDDGQEGWEPSTKIAAAWEVVLKLDLFYEKQLFSDERNKWIICDYEEYLYYTEKAIGFISAETAPHAICLAALKALGYSAPNKE